MNLKSSPCRFALLMMVVAGWGGCANEPAKVSLTRTAPTSSTSAKRKAPPTAFSLHLTGVVDRRPAGETLGYLNRTVQATEDVAEWVRTTLLATGTLNGVSFHSQPESCALAVEIQVRRLYVDSNASSKNGVVVFEAVFSKEGREIGRALCRGQHTNWNWGSGEEEISAGLNRALQKAFVQLADQALQAAWSDA